MIHEPSTSQLPLSVCLITRDEAHNLPGLMASVRGLAREVVVVDTGSRDTTCEVAAALGARVLQTPWEDDFAKARNVALEAATCEWILSMDADQQLDAESRPFLEAALSRQDCNAQLVTIRLLGPSAEDGTEHVVQRLSSLRLFRRDPRIRYRWRVHEDVADSLIEMGSAHWPDSGVTLTDHGYMEAQARASKRERNLELLRRAHREQPDSLYTAYKLAITLPGQAAEERLAVLVSAMKRAKSTTTGWWVPDDWPKRLMWRRISVNAWMRQRMATTLCSPGALSLEAAWPLRQGLFLDHGSGPGGA
jgi:glycosyltransferase involved in cell wall biosynthesis